MKPKDATYLYQEKEEIPDYYKIIMDKMSDGTYVGRPMFWSDCHNTWIYSHTFPNMAIFLANPCIFEIKDDE